MFNEQQEISADTINKYMACVNNLSICTGKLDMLLSYTEQNYNQDKFLLSSLESILKDILNANGNKTYSRIKVGSHEIKAEIKSIIGNKPVCEQKAQERSLNVKKVQTPHKEIKQALKPIVDADNKNNSYYVFKNSTNLAEIISTNKIKTRIKFQNGRLYDYFNIPQNKIETLITCDKNMISPGKYFNSEIRSQYGYREVTQDLEMVG